MLAKERRMDSEDVRIRRVRFYGLGDYGTFFQIDRAAEVYDALDITSLPTSAAEIIELHNVQKFIDAGLFPSNYDGDRRELAKKCIPQIRSAVAQFFTAVDDSNVAEVVVDVDFEYHADLLELLGRNRAFEGCSPESMLPALRATGVRLGQMLGSKKLVLAYDAQVREDLLASPRNAEHLVRKHFQKDVQDEIHLPSSLTGVDARALLQAYLETADANPNYVRLIESAPVNAQTGVDAKLKLLAKQRNQQMSEEFFENNEGIEYGCGVYLSDTQEEPVTTEINGMVSTLTYGESWLRETLDFPSILNNFQYLFEFADSQVVLTLPSYPSQLGVFERFLTTTGKTDYHTGAAFGAMNMASLLQVRLYEHYLQSKGIELEEVIRWFFEDYLTEEFRATNFSFAPTDPSSSYLQRTRHLLAEMESVALQFSLYAENGNLDRQLLEITSDPVRYREIPSRVPGKYVYSADNEDIRAVLFQLFSDQSPLTYISDEVQADTTAELLVKHHVPYESFADHQRPIIDHLLALGVLEVAEKRVQFADAPQFRVLSSLFHTCAASYYHLSAKGRAAVDAMQVTGWIDRRSTLLTEAEASYFNYFLNKVQFTNGPELRNKHLHGSQANGDGEDAHFHSYLHVLRLLIALVIKLNDDFALAS
jgi:hypothetical protein